MDNYSLVGINKIKWKNFNLNILEQWIDRLGIRINLSAVYLFSRASSSLLLLSSSFFFSFSMVLFKCVFVLLYLIFLFCLFNVMEWTDTEPSPSRLLLKASILASFVPQHTRLHPCHFGYESTRIHLGKQPISTSDNGSRFVGYQDLALFHVNKNKNLLKIFFFILHLSINSRSDL